MLIKQTGVAPLSTIARDSSRVASTGRPTTDEQAIQPAVDQISLTSGDALSAERAAKMGQLKELLGSPLWVPPSAPTAEKLVSNALSRSAVSSESV